MTVIHLIALLAALTVVVAAYAIYAYSGSMIDDKREMRRRLDFTRTDQLGDASTPTDILKDDSFSSVAGVDALLQKLSVSDWLQRLLVQAGTKMQLSTLLYLQSMLAVVAAFVTHLFTGAAWSIAIVIGVGVGGALPIWYVRRMRAKRFQAFGTRFPAALGMLQSSLHAGHALNYALEVATEELPEPIASEFRQVLEEMRLGLSPRAALQNLCDRVPIPELRFFMIAVVLTREVGGNLSGVLETLAATLRDRQKVRAQCRALSAQGRASAIMLFMLPPGVAFMANVVSPGFIEPLYTTHAGRICAAVALGFQVAGVLMIRKIVNPKEFSFG